MNKWECDAPGCKNTAVGTGGAIGLRAIGWYFVPSQYSGPHIFCPWHRPDGIPCEHPDEGPAARDMERCSVCASEAEARRWQEQIMATVAPEYAKGGAA